MPFPENERGLSQLLFRVSSKRFERIPNAHVPIWIESQLDARVSSEVLIWEE